MSGRILKFPDPHQAVDELLPWFVNGTLEGEELALVERHVAECARCRHEVEALRGFQAAYVESELIPAPSDRLEPARRATRPSVRGWNRWLRGWRSWWSSIAALRQFRNWAPWALVAQLAVILVLAGMLITSRESQPLYRTLGDEPPAQQMGRLVVVFDPQVTEADLRRIVRLSGARIVDGPTVGDAYVLEVPAARQAEALQALRGQRAVAMAERLNSGVAR